VVNEVPDQIDPRRTNVVSDVRIQVEMPGTAQIDGVGKQRLAEQLAFTFGLIQSSPSTLRLTDGGKPVSIPGVGDDFSTSDFPAVGPSSVLTSVPFFYLRNGVLIGSDGKPIPGRINEGHYGLTGVSLRPGVKGEARVVAVSATALLMGSLAAGLVRVPVPAATLSRPEWRPNSDDAWVGTERGLFRIGADSRPVSIVATSSRGSLPAGRVTALRFSTDGSRLALVLQAADRTSALWIGSVVTSGAEVRIDSLEPITPSALSVFDIAWSSATSRPSHMSTARSRVLGSGSGSGSGA